MGPSGVGDRRPPTACRTRGDDDGPAIELRLYAEDPVAFLPRTGRLLAWEEPSGPGIRVDAGVQEGSTIGLDYDPLLAKLVVSAGDRPAAIARARRALADWVVLGVETNAPLLDAVLASEEFASGRYAAAGGLNPAENSVLLRAMLLDKAVYEVVYEARNRPTWVPIPLESIAEL